MEFTRRGVLAGAALLQSSLLGGCFGGSDGTRAGTPDTTSEDATATVTATATATATPTDTPAPESPLATATRTILAEYVWFRDEYEAAIRGLRVNVNRVLGVIEELESTRRLSAADVEALRTATTAVADYVNANLAAHFDVDRALRVGDNVFVRRFDEAVARGDVSLQDTVLSRARTFYRRAISRPYVDNEFSRRPVYGPLYEALVPGKGDRIVALVGVGDDDFATWAHPDRTESSATDGIDQHVHEFPGGYRSYAHAHEHGTTHSTFDHGNEPAYDRLYAHGDDGVALLADTKGFRERLDDYEPQLTGLFGPARSPTRTAAVYAYVGEVGPAFTATPLYVEAFDSAAAARDAVSGGDVSSEGTETFDGREWTRIFYEADGTTVYAYRVRAGATVVTALPSDVPWGNRADWTVDLGPTWIGATE